MPQKKSIGQPDQSKGQNSPPKNFQNQDQAATASAKAQASDINDSGEALYLAGSKKEALDRFRLAIEMDPECVDAHNNIGVYFWDTGNLEASIVWFKKALKIKPDDVDALANMKAISQIISRETSPSPDGD